MSTHRQLTWIMVLSCMLFSRPAIGQTGPSSARKEQTTAGAKAVSVSRPARVRFGGFIFSAGYRRYSGVFQYYYFYPHSFYQPWFNDAYYPYYYGSYSPLWYHPGWYTGFARQSGMGEIKLLASPGDADVLIDDGLAGKAKDLKTMWLEPGAYNLEVQADNYEPFAIRIFVLSGKTIKVDAKLAPQKEP